MKYVLIAILSMFTAAVLAPVDASARGGNKRVYKSYKYDKSIKAPTRYRTTRYRKHRRHHKKWRSRYKPLK